MRRECAVLKILPLLILACGAAVAPHARAAELPPGKGRDTFNKVCTACHDADVAMQQRNTRAGWAKIVESMKDMGAEGTPAQFSEIIDYLSEHSGGQAGGAAPGANTARPQETERPALRRALPWEKNSLRVGQALYRENCVVCHDIDGIPGKKIGPSFQGLFQKEKMPLANARPTRGFVTAKMRVGGRIMPSFTGKLSPG
jgi:mono/diheme cytochrome c family protein